MTSAVDARLTTTPAAARSRHKEPTMPRIVPNLWFDKDGLEAAEFYCSIFPNSKITRVLTYGEANPEVAGSVLTVEYELDGQPMCHINGGPMFQFDEASSLLVDCKDQAEVDYYWEKLLEGGGTESMCGWLKDKYGYSWQVAPVELNKLLEDPDSPKAVAATNAIYGMRKLDLAEIQRAYDEA
jgi:predicted 3-demethylubiquinone-9 3-methyltransferase (glyoxalase superfamily)